VSPEAAVEVASKVGNAIDERRLCDACGGWLGGGGPEGHMNGG
jgi:hypothetical protein